MPSPSAITRTTVARIMHDVLRIPTGETEFLLNTARDDGKADGIPDETSPLSGAILTVHHAGNELFSLEIH